jgi:hypothetical protein
MSLLRFSTQTLAVVCLALTTGCKDRSVVVYRTAKEGATPAPTRQAAPSNDTLPAGHPPIEGMSTNAGTSGPEAGLPAGHPPIGGATAPDGSAMGALPASAVAAGNALVWATPATWQPKNPGSVRKGSYAINGPEGSGDLGVTAFPGDTGGLHANINRWRGQIGLAPSTNADIEKFIERFNSNGLQIDFVEMIGPSGIRLLGGIVPHGNETWFFKLTGPDALIGREKPAFREFLNTIKVR